MKYRFLVASDMDYTLLMPGENVSEENKRAIRAIRDMGGAFTLATGRTFYLITKYIRDLEVDVPCIVSNGGALYDPRIREEIHSSSINRDTVKEIYSVLLQKGIDFAGYSKEAVYFAPESSRKQFFYDYNEGAVEEDKAKIKDIEGTCDLDDLPDFNKILVVDADKETYASLRARTDIESCASTGTFLDLMAPGASKGAALMKLADILGIDKENVFALGDNENDLSMLKSAGHGIAMGDSSDDVKKPCAFITSTCEESGFAKAVFDFILPLYSNR